MMNNKAIIWSAVVVLCIGAVAVHVVRTWPMAARAPKRELHVGQMLHIVVTPAIAVMVWRLQGKMG